MARKKVVRTSEQEAKRRKQAADYLRVSTKEQAKRELDPEGLSVPDQRRVCARQADDLGADLVAEFVELAETAKVMNRPELQKLLNDEALLARIDYLIVYNLSRLARNVEDQIKIIRYLRSKGVELVSATEHIDDTPAGKLMANMMASWNQYHSDNSAAEALRGMTQKARVGGTPGRAPVGYRNVTRLVDDRPVKTVEVDPERARLVQWGFEQYATGDWTITTLHEALVVRGLKCLPNPNAKVPGPIHRSQVQTILTNRYYIGCVTFNGVEYEGRHQPLVSEQLFDQVQAILAAHHRSGEKQRKHHHYLKGSVFCSRCESRLCLTKVKGNGGTYSYFFCLGRHARSGCPQKYVPVEEVEAAVERHYLRHVRMPRKKQEHIRRGLRAELDRQRKKAVPEVEYQRRRVKELMQERRRLARGVVDGSIPGDLARDEQQRIKAELANAEQVLLASETLWAHIENGLTAALDLLGRWDQVYLVGGPQIRRHSNQALFERIKVKDGEVVGAVYREPWATLVADDFIEQARCSAEDPEAVLSGRGLKSEFLAPSAGFEPATHGLGNRRSIP